MKKNNRPESDASMEVDEAPEATAEAMQEATVNTELLVPEPLLHPSNLWLEGLALPSPEDRHENLPTVIAMVVDPVYCRLGVFNQAKTMSGGDSRSLPSHFVVLAPFSAGWGKAPLEDKPLKNAEFLSEIHVDADGRRGLMIYSFDKHESNQQYKGAVRKDVATLVQAGCTLRLSTTTKTFEFEKQNKKTGQRALFPDVDTIHPFTLVKLFLKPNNATKGRHSGGRELPVDPSVSMDWQPYHASYPVPKCCRVHIDLGPKLNPEGYAVDLDMQAVPNYLCMQLNSLSRAPPSPGWGTPPRRPRLPQEGRAQRGGRRLVLSF
ncbi:hypothetical protein GUITHDRAFT_122966 [Guillardia theta CCMP2712]|uniref:Uncharacterized protein n=1 Tax=Guillardia theta (strain CCMP2712) TaxID=905079 RepID=L1I3N9_GUITC|nr:hypothetical protein GUITHDRAFT_122966 [Guillardia theta CCMP2712]EKX30821.1 hypothetical protein GUITHDRAFT_122966 [Guillardia theta CCMP2712]|eukprot:XP_005817801.1 hypothetical protein GUITHDRAFT_122966 [Guillardia theta CCMP2712]